MNAALKYDGNTPDVIDLLISSVMNGASTSTLSFKRLVSWKRVCGALLVRKFADGSDDVIIGEAAKSQKFAVCGDAAT